MGLTRKEIHTEEINLLGAIFKTMGHPVRITILMYLAETGSANTSEIVEYIGGLSQSTVSAHIKSLLEMRVIRGYQFQTSMIYSLEKELLQNIERAANIFFECLKKGSSGNLT
jgi:DNA-binding transcriptional ArsR family regulator